MQMEIAIGYDENTVNVMSREEAQKRMKAAVMGMAMAKASRVHAI